MELRFEWHRYSYFPYERELAVREVAALYGRVPVGAGKGLRLDLPVQAWREKARRLTYFSRVRSSSGTVVVPTQAALEARGTARMPAD